MERSFNDRFGGWSAGAPSYRAEHQNAPQSDRAPGFSARKSMTQRGFRIGSITGISTARCGDVFDGAGVEHVGDASCTVPSTIARPAAGVNGGAFKAACNPLRRQADCEDDGFGDGAILLFTHEQRHCGEADAAENGDGITQQSLQLQAVAKNSPMPRKVMPMAIQSERLVRSPESMRSAAHPDRRGVLQQDGVSRGGQLGGCDEADRAESVRQRSAQLHGDQVKRSRV